MTKEQWVSPRERMEANASPAVLHLADAFADQLRELGWHDFAARRAVLLSMATKAEEVLAS